MWIDTPLVSVVVYTFNSAKYVLESLNSVLYQTYDNMELIVSDDASSDETLEICKSWITKYESRFKRTEIVRSDQNSGIPANCNRGAKAAKGDWIKFLAGDDILVDECISSYIHAIEKNPEIKFITSELEYLNIDKRFAKHNVKLNRLRNFFFNLDANEQLKQYARFPFFLNTPAFFINTALLQCVGHFDEDFFLCEDEPIVFRILQNNAKVFCLNSKTVIYRLSSSNTSRKKGRDIERKRINEREKCFLKYRKNHLSKMNLVDLSVLYEFWLKNVYTGINGIKGIFLFEKLSLFHWYMVVKLAVNRKFKVR